MKKFLLSLAVLFAGMASAQTYYQVGSEVEGTFETDTEYLLSCDVAATRFLVDNGTTYLTEDIPTESALIVFEEAEYDEKTEMQYYYIKFSNSGLYLADQEMPDGLDSSDTHEWKLPYIFKTDDVNEAALWTVLPAEVRGERAAVGAEDYVNNWRVWTGKGTGEGESAIPFPASWVIMRKGLSTPNENTGSKGGQNPVYLEVQSNYIMFASWGENAWFISEPEEMDEDMLLEAWVESNLPDGVDYLTSEEVDGVGFRAGQITPESFEALQAAYTAYETYIDEEEGDPAKILADLMAALEKLEQVPVKEGYYYLTSKRGSYVAYDLNGGITGKGGFVIPTEEETGEPSVTVETSQYLWYFNPVADKESTFIIQNFGTGKYATTSDHNTQLKTAEEGAEYIFEFLEGRYGVVYIYHKNAAGTEDCAWNIFNGWEGTPVGNWKGRNDDGCFWYLTQVSDDKVVGIQEEVKQYALNQHLQGVYDNAVENYLKGRSYKAPEGVTGDGDFVDHGFVKLSEAVDTAGNPIQTINVTCNAPETTEGNILAMADNDYNTFFHSTWSAFDASPKPHNLIVDLGAETELPAIAIKMLKRNTGEFNANRAVTKWIVYGTNDDPYNEEVAANWTAEGTVLVDYSYDYLKVSGTDSIKVANGVGMGATGLSGAAYRYIRLDAVNNLNNEKNHFFAFSELGLWTATYDEATSLNTVVPAAILSALETQMAAAKAQLAEGKATEDQITALQKALDEFIENFPEPQRLADAITAAKQISANLPTGDDASYYPEAALADFDAVVAEVEATVAPVMTLAAINEGIEKLAAAKTALLKTMNMPANGYYQIRIDAAAYVEAILYASTDAVDTEEKNGLMARFSKPEIVDEYPVDDVNYTASVSSIWYLEQGADNKVAVRSLSNGLYLQSNLRRGNKVQLAPEKVYLDLQADGLTHGDAYNFVVGTDSVSGNTLYCNINSSADSKTGELVSWDSAAGQDNSTFRLEEVNLAEFANGKNNFVMAANATKFMTFAYDCKYFYQTAKIYEALGFYEGEEANYVYFQQLPFGSEIVAGQGYLVKAGEGNEVLTVQFEAKEINGDMFNYSYEAKSKNGLTGTIFTTEVGAKYGVIGFGGAITATANTTNDEGEEVPATIAPFSGYIDGNTLPVLDAAPEKPEVVRISTKLDINGLNAIEGVEVVETAKAGVYTISGVRLNSAKNLPAGIYIINGKKVIK